MADKVLIVDDDISICKLLEKVMHSNELETTTVNCGMNLIQKWQEAEKKPWSC